MEVCRSWHLQAAAGVFKRFSGRTDRHGRVEVRELICCTRTPHRRKAARIQAEEINSRHAFVADVGPHIQFAKLVEKRQRRSQTAADTAHPEWSNGNVSRSIAQIKLQLLRDQGSHFFRRKRPMGKKQVMPILLHGPLRAGHGDGAVRGFKQQWMHGSTIVNRIALWPPSSPLGTQRATLPASPACCKPMTFACSWTFALFPCRGGIRISIVKIWSYGCRRLAATISGKKTLAGVAAGRCRPTNLRTSHYATHRSAIMPTTCCPLNFSRRLRGWWSVPGNPIPPLCAPSSFTSAAIACWSLITWSSRARPFCIFWMRKRPSCIL